jgi:hypothetical protein
VRKHYCKKAVESKAQVAFLETHFGVKPTKGYKEGKLNFDSVKSTKSSGHSKKKDEVEYVSPLSNRGSIWGNA